MQQNTYAVHIAGNSVSNIIINFQGLNTLCLSNFIHQKIVFISYVLLKYILLSFKLNDEL